MGIGTLRRHREQGGGEPEPVDATDAARELAVEEGVDLVDIGGTGSDGRVLKSDVEAAVEAG